MDTGPTDEWMYELSNHQATCPRHLKAWDSFMKQDLGRAAQLFRALRDDRPDDPVLERLATLCTYLHGAAFKQPYANTCLEGWSADSM